MTKVIQGGGAGWLTIGKTPQGGVRRDEPRSGSGVFHGIREESAGVSALAQRLERLERELADARAQISWLVNVNEELESVNEELYTVNGEYHEKLAELAALRDDHDNLLGAMPIGVVFIDEQLVLRHFNGEAARALLLQPEHVGSSLAEVAGSTEYAHLLRESRCVLGTTGSRLFEIRGTDGKPWACELMQARRSGAGGLILLLCEH